MTDNPIYQLDVGCLRGFNPLLATHFPTPDVIAKSLRWHPLLETLVVSIEHVEPSRYFAVVPCDWLTPNPAPHFRFITTAANGNPISDETVQGIPVEYADYAPILLRDGFEWVGINLGSQRVSIERVFPPVGEGVS